jgi:hypothetical protein
MSVTVGIGSSAFLFGALLFLIAILGGGFEVKEIKIPRVSLLGRFISTAVGGAFICLGLVVTAQENPVSSKESTSLRPTTTVAHTTSTTRPVSDTRLLPSQAIRVTASSSLPRQGGYDYKPENTLDNRPWTAWNEGAPGDGVGASLLYEFHRQANLQRLEIINGYAKSPKAYAENARIQLARITTATDSTTVILNDVASWQSLRAPNGPTDFVRLEILEIYPGSRYHDCAVTEVRFFERR